MDGHGQVRPPTHESVPEMPISSDEFFRAFDRLGTAIDTLTKELQAIFADMQAVQEEKRDNLTHSILKQKFRVAMREHNREAQ